MASVTCTLALKENASINCNLDITRDAGGKQTWARWKSSVGGLQLGAAAGPWEWDAPTNALWLLKGEDEEYAISLLDVPSDFLLSVSCGTSIQGYGSDTNGKQLQYKLWMGCA